MKSNWLKLTSLCAGLSALMIVSACGGKSDSKTGSAAQEEKAPWRNPTEIVDSSTFVSDAEQADLEKELDGKEFATTLESKEINRLIFYVTSTGLHYSEVTYNDVPEPKESDKTGSILFYTVKFMKDASGNIYLRAKSGSIWTVLEYPTAKNKLIMQYSNNANAIFKLQSSNLDSVDWGKDYYLQWYN